MSTDGGTCEFTHDLGEDTWHCPHEVYDGGADTGSSIGVDGRVGDDTTGEDATGPGPTGGVGSGGERSRRRCVFHLPIEETPDGAAAEAFLERVNESGRRCKEFVGARFSDLDLAFVRIDAPDNHPVNLADATVAGRLSLTSGAVTQPLVLDGLTVEGETVCENTTFDAECAAGHAQFRGSVDFQGALFRERIRLQDATFRGPANFHAVEFDETADFEWVDFEAPTDFAGAGFGGDAVFTGTRFAETADFDSVVVDGKSDFRGVRFAAEAVFRDARFEDSVAFGVPATGHRSAVEVDFHEGGRESEPVFEFEGVLEHVDRRVIDPTEDRAVDDDVAHFQGEADFLDAEFVEEVHFEAVEFGEVPRFRDVTFRDPVVFHEPTVAAGVLDLRESELPAGTLGQAANGVVVYDLEGATLGDLHIQGGRGAPFEHCRFLHTTFDGFDFGRYRDSVAAAEWCIHTTLEDLDREEPTLGDLEATYLKAKNGAKAHGDDKAAAEFFRQELSYRRRRYARTVLEGDRLLPRLLAGARWCANALLKASSGYGTRPSRVVLFSASVVAVCAMLFRVLRPEAPYPSRPRLGYLLLSLESFATGVRAGGPVLDEPAVRLLMEIEAFIGAFLIALFVFTLTRSINR